MPVPILQSFGNAAPNISWRATVANLLWRAACEPARSRLRRALEQPEKAQAGVLRRILRDQEKTEFARQHQLHPSMSASEFQRAVPLSNYAGHQPGIERTMAGERDVLTAGIPDAFERSSGSTSAAKFIPLTAGLRREFQEAVRAWMGDLLARHPKAMLGPAWWVISPLRQPGATTSGGIPIGLAGDDEYLGKWERKLAFWLWAVPPAIARLEDLNENLDWTVRFLLERADLRLISIWNPSYLSLLWQRFASRSDEFLHQLANGTGPSDRPFLLAHLRAMPRRAETLKSASRLDSSIIWPQLAVISGWADGEAARDAETMRNLFPHAVYQPKGLLATEGVVTIPWGDDSAAGVPALNSHFLEFIDETNGSPRLVHELECGKTYGVALTTSGGLWRYQLGDRVRVEGSAHQTPRLRFIGRSDDVCDLRGEKLHPGFVENALKNITSGFRMLAPCREAETVCYVLFVKGHPPSARSVDEALSANPHYSHARAAGQLCQARVFQMTEAAPESAYLRRCAELGQRAGTIKATVLHRTDGWEHYFTGHFVMEEEEVPTP